MSATYGILRSDMTATQVTKRGRHYVEATVQTEHVRCSVEVNADGLVRIALRATNDRNDSGKALAYVTLYPAQQVLDSDRPVLYVESGEPLDVRNIRS